MSVARVPSICDEMTASLRTNPYTSQSTEGTISPATASRSMLASAESSSSVNASSTCRAGRFGGSGWGRKALTSSSATVVFR